MPGGSSVNDVPTTSTTVQVEQERAPKRHRAGEEHEPADTPSASDAGASWSEDSVRTPSGRDLRDVQGWLDSGVALSSTSDQAARLLDMAAEQILGVFGDPYGVRPPRMPSPRRATERGSACCGVQPDRGFCWNDGLLPGAVRGQGRGQSGWAGMCRRLMPSWLLRRLRGSSDEDGPRLRCATVCDAVVAAARLERQAWRAGRR